MSTDVTLSCDCGGLRGTAHDLSPKAGLRLACCCIDCQTYAHHLGAQARVLDASGATEVFQTTPRHLTIEVGREHLRSLRQSPKGAVRWYAGCCRTPLANGAPSAGIPFAGVVASALRFEDEAARAATLGPVRGVLNAASARGPLLHPEGGMMLTARAFARIGVALLRGEQRPSPFYDDQGMHLAPPELMSRETRARLREEVRAAGAN